MKLSRRTVALSALALLVIMFGLCGLSILLVPDEEPEPIAAVQSTAAPPARISDATAAPTRARPTKPAPAAAQTAPGSTETAAPTERPTRTLAPTAALVPTDAPTRTPRPTSPPRPTATTVPPTATDLPPTATAIPLPSATAAPTLPPPTATRSGVETAIVTNIVDGDTIDVNLNGQIVRVRYIGMNTPESNEVCGSEATAANAALVAGRTVTMVRDVSETDRYGRLLRYVYVDGVFVNGELVAGGWADAVDYPPDTAQSGTLHSLMAQGAGRGCDLVAAPLPTQPAVEPAPTAPVQGGNCDPSYPDVCIAPPPPDLDCKDVPYKRFRVLAPDPHNFDGNHDGVGCEG